ncbi:hypothetical protein TNCV_4266301 [Trichonephila clavipes]|nr:hypothetical protein TNCV_4266301 [Trichonephila clavipes]
MYHHGILSLGKSPTEDVKAAHPKNHATCIKANHPRLIDGCSEKRSSVIGTVGTHVWSPCSLGASYHSYGSSYDPDVTSKSRDDCSRLFPVNWFINSCKAIIASGLTTQGGPWPSQEAFSRLSFFLPVFSNSELSKLDDLFLGHQST